jgi:hypothetical protein
MEKFESLFHKFLSAWIFRMKVEFHINKLNNIMINAYSLLAARLCYQG